MHIATKHDAVSNSIFFRTRFAITPEIGSNAVLVIQAANKTLDRPLAWLSSFKKYQVIKI
jgi:hypothetical protein